MITKTLAGGGPKKQHGIGLGGYIVLAAIAFGCFWWFSAQSVRVPVVQVPVAARVEPSFLFGNVLRLMNNSNKALTGVRVSARNPGSNANLSVNVGQIQPGEIKEIGTLDWGWVVEKGETVTVSADGFPLPIVFSAEQLGVK